MSNSAKIVLWMGLFMILAGVIKNWSLFRATLFGGGIGTPPIYGAQGSGIPPPTGILPNPKTKKCPPGYNFAYGKCWSPAQNPIPPTSVGA